jgi:hypothetical protein
MTLGRVPIAARGVQTLKYNRFERFEAARAKADYIPALNPQSRASPPGRQRRWNRQK